MYFLFPHVTGLSLNFTIQKYLYVAASIDCVVFDPAKAPAIQYSHDAKYRYAYKKDIFSNG